MLAPAEAPADLQQQQQHNEGDDRKRGRVEQQKIHAADASGDGQGFAKQKWANSSSLPTGWGCPAGSGHAYTSHAHGPLRRDRHLRTGRRVKGRARGRRVRRGGHACAIETARGAREEARRVGADCAVAIGRGSTTGLGKAIERAAIRGLLQRAYEGARPD